MSSGLSTFTAFHVLVSLAAIATGFVVLLGLCQGKPMARWTLLFLVLTAGTTITGFLFPFNGFTPAIGVGILSSFILILAFLARYRFQHRGAWRWIYVVSAVASLYFNCFVLVVQSFLKIPSLHALAPNGAGPVFAATQGAVLVFFLATGFLAVRTFRPALA